MNISLLLILFFVGAIATYASGDKLASKVAVLFSTVTFGFTLYLINLYNSNVDISYTSTWIAQPQINFALKADGLSLLMVLLTTSLIPIIIYSSFGTAFTNAKSLFAHILLMAFAMTGTFLASDGLLYYIFWELALIPIYFIALIWGNGEVEERRKAVVKFFIYTFAGSLFMLVAFVYLYQKNGNLVLEDLYKLTLTSGEQFWLFLGFFLAYAIKIPIIPFHTWQAKVYQKAPTIGTMLLSGIMLKMGLYSVIRWQLPITPIAAKQLTPILISMGIVGVIYGSIVALRQKDLKKLLAYSSLAHVGLIASGLYTLTLDGLRGAVLQMIAHGFVVVGLFFAAEIIYRRFETRTIDKMGGIRIQASKFTSVFLIIVLASVALPSTFNFIGEFTVLYSLYKVNTWFAILGGLTVILGAYYMLKMFQNVMLGEKNALPFKEISTSEIITFVLIISVVLFFGLYPKPIVDFITPTIENTLNTIEKYDLVNKG
jgi:NADH-quinone oxidoreductase subunit M